MTSHIAAGAAKCAVATIITAVCFGSVAVPSMVAAAAPATASAVASAHVTPDGGGNTPWG